MRDYYEVLGVRRDASVAEIRRAYRKKAKLLHPDYSKDSSEEFLELQRAYETLSNVRTRALFDENTSVHHGAKRQTTRKESFDYRTWLLARDDDESHAKLIFFDLMHHNEDSAVAEFKRMNMKSSSFRLSRWFAREDFMDFGFILAEELVLRQEYYDAVILLSQIIQMEYRFEYFKLFFPEVKELARHILRNDIEGSVSDELAIDAWEQALDLRFGKHDDAFFLGKMADAYDRIGDRHTARLCREEAMRQSEGR